MTLLNTISDTEVTGRNAIPLDISKLESVEKPNEDSS